MVAGPSKYHYRLHSVVRHLGSSPLAGHYIADVFRFRLVKSRQSRSFSWGGVLVKYFESRFRRSFWHIIDRFDAGGWWRYDDSEVTQTRWIWISGNVSLFEPRSPVRSAWWGETGGERVTFSPMSISLNGICGLLVWLTVEFGKVVSQPELLWLEVQLFCDIYIGSSPPIMRISEM